MFLVMEDKRDNLYLINLDAVSGLEGRLEDNHLSLINDSPVRNLGSAEAVAERLEDIVKALDSGKVNVYDIRKPVGYWVPPKKAPAKTAPKTAPKEASK